MTNRVYEIIELVGTSSEGIEKAINNGVAQIKRSNKNIDWFEVVEARGHIHESRVNDYQVHLKVGCYEAS